MSVGDLVIRISGGALLILTSAQKHFVLFLSSPSVVCFRLLPHAPVGAAECTDAIG